MFAALSRSNHTHTHTSHVNIDGKLAVKHVEFDAFLRYIICGATILNPEEHGGQALETRGFSYVQYFK